MVKFNGHKSSSSRDRMRGGTTPQMTVSCQKEHMLLSVNEGEIFSKCLNILRAIRFAGNIHILIFWLANEMIWSGYYMDDQETFFCKQTKRKYGRCFSMSSHINL